MTIADMATVSLASIGVVFFIGGTVGLLRFPDVYSRLHALTKADNLGLGLISIALIVQADHAGVALKVVVIWLLAMLGAATVSQLIARAALSDAGQGLAGMSDDAGSRP